MAYNDLNTEKTPEQIAAEVSKPSAYFEGSRLIIRASALGSCPLRLAHVALGRAEKYPAATHKAFAAGHVYEEIAIAKLNSVGFGIGEQQGTAEYQSATNKEILIRGHYDGKILNPVSIYQNYPWLTGLYANQETHGLLSYQGAIAEIKSSAPSSFEGFVSKGIAAYPNYKRQLAIYDAACSYIGAVIFFIRKGPLSATDEFIKFVCSQPDEIKNPVLCQIFDDSKLAIHAQFVSKLSLTGELPAINEKTAKALEHIGRLLNEEEIKCNEFRAQVFPCPFDDLHNDETEVLTDLTFEAMLDDYASISAQMSELKERQDDIKRIISQKLRTAQAQRMKCGVHTFQFIQGRESVDYGAISKAHPEFNEWKEEFKRQGEPYLRIDSRGRKE